MHKQFDVLFIVICVFACVDVRMYVERIGRKLGLGKASDSQGESVACSYYCRCVYIPIKITLLLLVPSFGTIGFYGCTVMKVSTIRSAPNIKCAFKKIILYCPLILQ